MSYTITRRQYLIRVAILNGASWMLAAEGVDSTAMEHPEWDMEETHTEEEWQSGEYECDRLGVTARGRAAVVGAFLG
jgi:hypothetical protein